MTDTTQHRREQPQDRPDMVYRELRELIVSGRLAPGTRLVETTVAKRLGVSRTPVRSALHRLQREGYVVAANEGDERQRLAVAPYTAADATDVFHIVGGLEGLAGFYAAGMARTRRQKLAAELARINKDLLREARAKQTNAFRAFQLDSSFHRKSVEDSAPPRLLALHDVIKPQAERYARLYVMALTNELGLSVAEHEVIVDAIRDGDAEAAQRAIQTNWRNAARRISSVIAEWGESGGW
ncbi:MAG: GntR family transcriptional regulator [Thermoanaerobaculales bacterium]|nr:GntR family transcriptional regulator [Thermoanaerobaculales bacterium]